MSLVFVGEAPGGVGPEARPALDASGSSGRRLAKMIGLSPADYNARIDRRNLFHSPDDGDPWRARDALLRARAMIPNFRRDDHVVLLGRRVAEAFGCDDLPLYEWVSFQRIMTGETFWVARVPHPSGRNRQLNDERERVRMASFLRGALRWT